MKFILDNFKIIRVFNKSSFILTARLQYCIFIEYFTLLLILCFMGFYYDMNLRTI